MSFFSNAQTLYVIDPISPASQLPADDNTLPHSDLNLHSHEHDFGSDPHQALTVGDEHIEVGEPGEIEIVVEELPGAPPGTKDPEPILEVSEGPVEDSNEAKKDDKTSKWNWGQNGSNGFCEWIKNRLADVPKHSGFDSAGLERAISFMEKLDTEISKAMRLDLDGELDANKVEKVRAELDDGLSRLQSRLEKVKKTKKSNRKKKSEYEIDQDGLIKKAQKIAGVKGVYVMVPLLISRIARVIINGQISGGHDPVDMFRKQVEKYSLTDREQAEVVQLLEDSGLALRGDRGYLPNEGYSLSSSDNYDFGANFSDN